MQLLEEIKTDKERVFKKSRFNEENKAKKKKEKESTSA